MGVGCSRCCSDSRHSSLAPSTIPSQRPSGNGSAGSGASSYEQEREEALRLLRDEFKRRPTVFLISQILMSVQFFKNFNRDKLRILQLKEEKEEELNRALQKDKKSAAYLGSPYEVIGEVMAYCRRDGDEPCLGHDLEYLIMHDSIAVRTPSDELSPEEEARTYQFIMQRCRSEGYTRLRQTGRIPAPTIHRSRLSDIKSREWSHQSPLKESETEPGAKDRTSSGSAASPERTPDAEAAPPAKERQGAAVEKSGANATPVGSPSGSTDREGKAKSAAGAAKEAALGDRRRSRGADSSGDDSEGTSSSSLASAAGKRQVVAEPSANHQGEGQKFLENLKRRMNGDMKARVNLSDEEPSDEAENSAAQKPTLTITDESGADRKMSSEPELTSAAPQQGDKSQGAAGHPAQNGPEPADGSLASGSHMTSHTAPYGQPFPGQGAPMPGQRALKDPNAHFPGHVPPHVPFGHFPPPMGGAVPYHMHGVMPGYPQPTPENPLPLMMHPAAPHFAQFQPGMSPYQQFVGPYPMASPPVGWSPEQMMLGSQQPYMPGVPLANQNPAVGFGMPGMPGQPVPPGYLGAGHPYMHPAPMSAGHHLNTISEGRANTKPRRAAAEAKRHTSDVSSSHLMPPSQHHGRRKSRSKSNASLLAPVDSRRQSTSSSTSRLSFLDSTTTDEEGDTPGLVPHHCFRKLRMRVDTGDDDDEDVWHEPHYVTHRFLSSERFLGVFADRFGELVQLMARDAWLQHGGRGLLNGAVVQCREVLPSGLRTTARITATLQVSSWPSEHAFEWALRKRTELIDARNQWRFVWPPQRVVQNVLQEVGCNLVPLASQKGRAAELEWEIAFQQAEIKLISSLGLVHVHCWAAAKLFFTHFLSEFGCLQERHIRHLMFWQFENNFRDWRLEGLGATFVGLLSALKESVRERRLEHYFIRKRNLLQNESTGDLVSAQEKIQRVMENLLPNIIILMSRLQIRNKAFPTLDWQNLYDTLRMSTTDIMKKLIPELSISPDGELGNHRDSLAFNPAQHVDDEEEDGWIISRRQQMEERYRQWQREQQKLKNKNRRERRNRAQAAPGKPLPEFAGPRDKLYTLGDGFQPRVEMVLSLFIRHFNAMAERLIEHESIYTALAYIDHSLNLCTLLSEEGGATETAEELREKVLELQAAAIAKLPAPSESVPQIDPDLLQMASGSGRASQDHSNWTVGPEKGPAARRDFNREAATATAGDMAEWQAQGGVRPETEGGDQAERTGSGSLFDGPALFGEMRVNPAFVEDQPKAEEDGAESDDAEVSRSGLRTSRGEADGSEDLDESRRGAAVGRSRSGSRGSSGQAIDEGEEEDEDDEEGGDEDEKSGTENDESTDEDDDAEDSEDTKM
ncbi:uncharacterized protein LOC122363198 [Amphibalanus amphitrite]|uniref:uncharacterized protein LOC122363198 n=1 Tax=Amphibalanus amphitrite TaxID=1232801 RepID=UPI001C906C21|nr:uncharacterized protein LOC122363198 [Amphibalanus amphitrite]